MFHHHDLIRAARKGCSCHDLNGLTRSYNARECFTSAHFADDDESSRKIRAAHGEAVADGAVCGWIVAIVENVLGKNASGRLLQRNLFHFGQRPDVFEYTGSSLFEVERRHNSIIAEFARGAKSSHPRMSALPPDFR